ncbi:MAG: hypothetical protein V1880_01490 [Patescibacteria group bacterium]
MKFTKKIAGLLLVFILTLNVSVPISHAETEPEGACKEKKPDYGKLMEIWSGEKIQNESAYKKAFEAAQITHHDYVGCMFDFAEKEIISSDIDWMSPNQACLTPEELKKIIRKSAPDQLLGPILRAHADYRNHLQALGDQFNGKGVITDEDGKPVNQLAAIKIKSANLETVKRQTKLEVDSSLMAIDLMFTSLKELRLSLVMHVRFQCTLKFLDKYRRALEDLRNVIEPLPGQLEDASVS